MAEVYRGLILQYLRITSVSYLPSAAPWLHTSSKYRTSPFLHVHRDRGSERGRTQGENMRKAKGRKSCEVTDTNTIFLSYYSAMNRGGSAQAEEIVWMNEISWQHLHRGWWMRFVKVSASKLFSGHGVAGRRLKPRDTDCLFIRHCSMFHCRYIKHIWFSWSL